MSAEQDSTTVGDGGDVPLEGAMPIPPTVLDFMNDGTQHGPRPTTEPTPDPTVVLDEKGRRYTAKRFKSKQTLSTFISTLGIAYIAFVTQVQQRNLAHGSIPSNFGIFLALLAITGHGISIISCSQRIAMCNDFSTECTEEGLEYSLAVCGIVQFASTTCFIMAVFGSFFLFFDHMVYAVLFFAVSLVGLVAFVYGNGELTRVYHNILVIRAPWRVPSNRDPEA